MTSVSETDARRLKLRAILREDRRRRADYEESIRRGMAGERLFEKERAVEAKPVADPMREKLKAAEARMAALHELFQKKNPFATQDRKSGLGDEMDKLRLWIGYLQREINYFENRTNISARF